MIKANKYEVNRNATGFKLRILNALISLLFTMNGI